MDSLFALNWVEGGWASVQSMQTRQLEDHMPSYFLAEACKYLFLLFDDSFLQVPVVLTEKGCRLLNCSTAELPFGFVHCTKTERNDLSVHLTAAV